MLAASTGGIFLLVQGQLRWELRPGAYATASITYAVATLAVTVVLVVTTRSVAAVFLGQIVGGAAGIVVVAALARSTFARRFDSGWLRRLLAFSLPLVPSSLGVLTALYVDRIVIGVLLDLDDVALFSVGHRFASTVGLVMTAVQLALTPLIYAVYRRAEAPGQISDIFRAVVGLVLLLWLGVSLFAPELVTIVATDTYVPASTVIPLQMPAVILAGLIVFAPGLSIDGRTGTIALVTLGGAALNVLLNLLLVGPLGITGAGLATLTSAALVFALMMVMSQRSYRIPYPFASTALGVVAVSVTILLSGVPQGAAIEWPARLGLMLAASLALLVLGVVRPGRWLILARDPG
jgi:O-antigen/teichoic acid export membrane protein